MAPRNQSAEVTNAVAALSNRIEALSIKLDKPPTAPTDKPGTPRVWWEYAIQFLGLPVIVLGMVFTFTQINTESSNASLNKIKQTTELAQQNKANAEATKLKLEIEEIQRKQQAGIRVSTAERDDLLERVKSLIKPATPIPASALLLKYLALTFMFMGLSLFFQLVGTLWSVLFNLASNLIYANFPQRRSASDPAEPSESEADFEKRRKRYDLLRTVWQHFSVFAVPLPSLVDWSIRLSIFTAVVVPLFDETAATLGSALRFSDLLGPMRHWEVSVAVQRLHDLIAN